MRRWLIPATFILVFLMAPLLNPSGAMTELGEYRENFENATFELSKINESLSSMETTNVSALEELRATVSILKNELNVTDMEAAASMLEIERNARDALRNNVSEAESQNKKVFATVFGTFGLLTGFWGAFSVYTILSSRMKR